MRILTKITSSKSTCQPLAVISEHVILERVAGEYVILDLDSGEYYGLNGVGTRIFDLIQCHSNLEEVLTVMLQEYDVDEDRLRDDLAEIVARLVSKGFLVTRDDTSQ